MKKRTGRKLGGALKKFMANAKDFLKKSNVLSTVGKSLMPMTGSLAPMAQMGLDKLTKAGYGRRRMIKRRKGGSLVAVGGARRPMFKASRLAPRLNPKRVPDRSALKFRY
jgi:hypothetical protein